MTIMRCLWHGKSIEIAILMTILYEPRHEKNNVLVSDLVRHKSSCRAKMARGLNFGFRKWGLYDNIIMFVERHLSSL